MLWTILVILLVLWLLGFLGHVGGGLGVRRESRGRLNLSLIHTAIGISFSRRASSVLN